MSLALFQKWTDLFDANVAHWHSVELGRQILPDAGFFRAIGAVREDKFDLGQVRLRNLGE
ncbi:hypothetical protein D9M68_982100 [compost metagenome]